MDQIMCQACNKKPSIVHVTEILDGGERKELHLCEDCAREKKLGLPSTITIPEILSNLIEFYSEKEKPDLENAACSRCGLTYAEFRAKGRLGCGEDYTVFRKALLPLLQRIHQSTRHKGKMPCFDTSPRGVDKNLQLARLRRQLDEAVQKEEYERAAQLRDSIRLLTQEQHNEA
jgi:protein arginine kinase activator